MTTQRYMHLSPAALDAAIRLLEVGTAPGVSIFFERAKSTATACQRAKGEQKPGGFPG